MRRFTIESPLSCGMSVPLEGPLRHHMRVVRQAHDSLVEVIDANGAIFLAKVQKNDGAWIISVLEALGQDEAEAHFAVPSLLLAVGRSDATRRAVRMATELGCPHIALVQAHRSPHRALEQQLDGYRNVIKQALRQSKGGTLPSLVAFQNLGEACATIGGGIIADPQADETRTLDPSNRSTVAIGPEGGWTPDEVSAAKHAGWQPARLPGNILRLDTAVAVGLSWFTNTLRDKADEPV